MILIAHRGNLKGRNIKEENEPGYVGKALEKGFDVEIDVWFKDNGWWLGHDEPQYKTNLEFLKTKGLWCHAKNLSALEKMLENKVHCFWHEEDERVLTSKGFVWTYPGKALGKNSIAVMPEQVSGWDISKALGVCSDNLMKYK
ncbi:hypothetical protein KJ953_01560 [Patescibacteria group bacterium]|nr:hypothetical protein [Patescibacteria group bacterium]MBU1256754.1 hypothetical protein [Patescibacteria group bacterium]MBU1457588.1 hypothetical protein [Patescibacteria group bacterium]